MPSGLAITVANLNLERCKSYGADGEMMLRTVLLLSVLFAVAQCLYAQDVQQQAWTVLNAGLADSPAFATVPELSTGFDLLYELRFAEARETFAN